MIKKHENGYTLMKTERSCKSLLLTSNTEKKFMKT